MIRAGSRLVVVAMLGFGLAGCGLLPVFAPESQGPVVVSRESDGEGAPFDERCAELRLPGAVDDIWDGPFGQTGFPRYGVAGWREMWGTMLVQSDALTCVWTDGSGEAVISLIAVGEADDGYRLSEPSYAEEDSYRRVGLADGAYVGCWTDPTPGCQWNVLAGSTWVSVILADLPPRDLASADSPGSRSSELVEALASMSAGLGLPAIPSSGSAFESCLAAITPEAVAASYGIDAGRVLMLSLPAVDGSIFESHPDFGEMIAPYVTNRLGYSRCGVAVDEKVFVTFIHAPGAAWVLGDSNAPGPDLVDIENRGSGVESCGPDPYAPENEEFTQCLLATSVGDDLYLADLHPYVSEMYPLGDDERARAATWTLIDALIG